jgi:cysteine protease ATG4
LYAARQKAVDGMRHLLDSEAQPDKSPDTIWVMGVGHPGYRPSTPVDSPTSLAGDLPPEGFFQRRGSSSSGKASPPIKSDQANLRPAVWPKKKDPNQAGSPPPKGFGNIFSTSTLSLALPNATSSPSKDVDARAVAQADSPSRGKRKDKEVLRWPEQCESRRFYPDSIADQCSP